MGNISNAERKERQRLLAKGLRRCTKCDQILTINEFFRHKRSSDGLDCWCKKCHKDCYERNKPARLAQAKRWYQEHQEHVKAYRKEYHKRNRERRCAYTRKYYQENIEHCLVRDAKYREENREKRRQQLREYRQTPRGKQARRAAEQKRKARADDLPSDFTQEQWQYALNHFNHQCAYCGAREDLTQDHFIPLSKGGGYTATNIVPCCGKCNRSKKDRMPKQWIRAYGTSFVEDGALERIKEYFEQMD